MTKVKQITIEDTRFSVSTVGLVSNKRVVLDISCIDAEDTELLTTGISVNMSLDELCQLQDALAVSIDRIREENTKRQRMAGVLDSQYLRWKGVRGK